MDVSMNTAVLPDSGVWQTNDTNVRNSNVQDEDKNITAEEKYVSEIKSQIYEKNYDYVEKQIERFYVGEISSEEMKGVISDYLYYRIDSEDANATLEEKNKWLAKSFDYTCYWATVLARKVNMLEGIEVAKKYGFDRSTMNIDFVYYNADYYYKWEEVMKMTGECADQMAEELGIKDFERQCRYNFNETWGWGNEYGKMINIEAAPQKDFTFFYRDQIISQEGKNFESTIYRSNMVVNGRLVGDGEVGGKGITFFVPGKLADYPNRNHYYYPAMNAYDFYFKYGGGGDNELCGFLRNFVLYSKNKIFTDHIEEDLAKKSYLKYSYQAKMSMYMKQQRIME